VSNMKAPRTVWASGKAERCVRSVDVDDRIDLTDVEEVELT
jgi:hypothetical protein